MIVDTFIRAIFRWIGATFLYSRPSLTLFIYVTVFVAPSLIIFKIKDFRIGHLRELYLYDPLFNIPKRWIFRSIPENFNANISRFHVTFIPDEANNNNTSNSSFSLQSSDDFFVQIDRPYNGLEKYYGYREKMERYLGNALQNTLIGTISTDRVGDLRELFDGDDEKSVKNSQIFQGSESDGGKIISLEAKADPFDISFVDGSIARSDGLIKDAIINIPIIQKWDAEIDQFLKKDPSKFNSPFISGGINNLQNFVIYKNQRKLSEHLILMKSLSAIEIEFFGSKWTLEDLCHKPTIPKDIGGYFASKIAHHFIPCSVITILDCFWEGSLIHNSRISELPFPDGQIYNLSLQTLRPKDLMDKIAKTKLPFNMQPLLEFIKYIELEDEGYTSKPRINLNNPNYLANHPKQIDLFSEVMGKLKTNQECNGISKRLYRWPIQSILSMDDNDEIEALQSTFQLMSPHTLYAYWKGTSKTEFEKWNVKGARKLIEAFQSQIKKQLSIRAERNEAVTLMPLHFSQEFYRYSRSYWINYRFLSMILASILHVTVSTFISSKLICRSICLALITVFLTSLSTFMGLGILKILSSCWTSQLNFSQNILFEIIPLISFVLSLKNTFMTLKYYKTITEAKISSILTTFHHTLPAQICPFTFEAKSFKWYEFIGPITATGLCFELAACMAITALPINSIRNIGIALGVMLFTNFLTFSIPFPICLHLYMKRSTKSARAFQKPPFTTSLYDLPPPSNNNIDACPQENYEALATESLSFQQNLYSENREEAKSKLNRYSSFFRMKHVIKVRRVTSSFKNWVERYYLNLIFSEIDQKTASGIPSIINNHTQKVDREFKIRKATLFFVTALALLLFTSHFYRISTHSLKNSVQHAKIHDKLLKWSLNLAHWDFLLYLPKTSLIKDDMVRRFLTLNSKYFGSSSTNQEIYALNILLDHEKYRGRIDKTTRIFTKNLQKTLYFNNYILSSDYGMDPTALRNLSIAKHCRHRFASFWLCIMKDWVKHLNYILSNHVKSGRIRLNFEKLGNEKNGETPLTWFQNASSTGILAASLAEQTILNMMNNHISMSSWNLEDLLIDPEDLINPYGFYYLLTAWLGVDEALLSSNAKISTALNLMRPTLPFNYNSNSLVHGGVKTSWQYYPNALDYQVPEASILTSSAVECSLNVGRATPQNLIDLILNTSSLTRVLDDSTKTGANNKPNYITTTTLESFYYGEAMMRLEQFLSFTHWWILVIIFLVASFTFLVAVLLNGNSAMLIINNKFDDALDIKLSSIREDCRADCPPKRGAEIKEFCFTNAYLVLVNLIYVAVSPPGSTIFKAHEILLYIIGGKDSYSPPLPNKINHYDIMSAILNSVLYISLHVYYLQVYRGTGMQDFKDERDHLKKINRIFLPLLFDSLLCYTLLTVCCRFSPLPFISEKMVIALINGVLWTLIFFLIVNPLVFPYLFQNLKGKRKNNKDDDITNLPIQNSSFSIEEDSCRHRYEEIRNKGGITDINENHHNNQYDRNSRFAKNNPYVSLKQQLTRNHDDHNVSGAHDYLLNNHELLTRNSNYDADVSTFNRPIHLLNDRCHLSEHHMCVCLLRQKFEITPDYYYEHDHLARSPFLLHNNRLHPGNPTPKHNVVNNDNFTHKIIINNTYMGATAPHKSCHRSYEIKTKYEPISSIASTRHKQPNQRFRKPKIGGTGKYSRSNGGKYAFAMSDNSLSTISEEALSQISSNCQVDVSMKNLSIESPTTTTTCDLPQHKRPKGLL